MSNTFIPQCKTPRCTRACGTLSKKDPVEFMRYCSVDCMVSKGSRTDSEGPPCKNKVVTNCQNSKKPDGLGNYGNYCCTECRDGKGLGSKDERDDSGVDDSGVDDLVGRFPGLS